MQYAIFAADGRRAAATKLYDFEHEALQASEGYREQYGFFVDIVCTDHPQYPWETCPMGGHDGLGEPPIKVGDVYRTNSLVPLGPARVRITQCEPGARSASAVDTDTGTACVVLTADLHKTAPTGDARHDGYTLTDDGACTLCDVVKPGSHALRDHVMNVHPDDFCRLYHHQPCRAEQRRTATH